MKALRKAAVTVTVLVLASGTAERALAETTPLCGPDPATIAATMNERLNGAWTWVWTSGVLAMNGEINELPDVADPAAATLARKGDIIVLAGDMADQDVDLTWQWDEAINREPSTTAFGDQILTIADMRLALGCETLPVLTGRSSSDGKSADIYLVPVSETEFRGTLVSVQAEGSVFFTISLSR